MSAFITRDLAVNVTLGVIEPKSGDELDLDGRVGVITTFDTDANNYSFVENGTDEEVTVDYEPGDEFYVDGEPASNALFEDDIDEGDVVEWEERESEPDAHALTNTEVEGGFIGGFSIDAVDVDDPPDGDDFSGSIDVINTVTGDVVDTFLYGDLAGEDLYTVDGEAATEVEFEAALNEGDSLDVDDLGEDVETFNLTNDVLSGTVDSVGTDAIDVELSSGAVIEDIATNTGDNYTVDGEASNNDGFDDDVTVGDSVTFQDEGEIASWTLVNMPPTAQTGLAVQDANITDGFVIVDSGGPIDIDYAGGDDTNFFLDGEAVTQAEFEAAGEYTAGDSVSFTEADDDEEEILVLTNQALRGAPDTVNTDADTLNVLGPDDETVLATGADYTGADLQVNGSDVDEGTFEAHLVAVEDGVIDGYMEVDLDEDPDVFNVVLEE